MFDDIAAVKAALASSSYCDPVQELDDCLIERKCLFLIPAREQWIIDPGQR